MSSIVLNDKNFASVAHTGFRGTIAIDHIAGKKFEGIINPSVPDLIKAGYSFCGLKIYIANLQDLNELNDYPVDIIFSRKESEDKYQYISLSKKLPLGKLLFASNAIEIKFTDKFRFEGDAIDWKNIIEVEEQE